MLFFINFPTKAIIVFLVVYWWWKGGGGYNETPSEVNDKSEGDSGVKRDSTSVRL